MQQGRGRGRAKGPPVQSPTSPTTGAWVRRPGPGQPQAGPSQPRASPRPSQPRASYPRPPQPRSSPRPSQPGPSQPGPSQPGPSQRAWPRPGQPIQVNKNNKKY